jgi:glutamate dehydrogenase (NAD(P)+)
VAAKLFHEAGAKVVAVQDHRTTLFDPAGLDVPKMMEYASHSGDRRLPRRGHLHRAVLGSRLRHPDPGRAGRADHRQNAPKIKAKLVIEAPTARPRPRPTTSSASAISWFART